jgi:phospholipid-translocating ATPase
MVRRTRFWKGKKWQFAVKQQQHNDDGDDVAMSTDDSHFVFCNRPALNAQFRYVTNQTSTRKYSWWSFLPRSLFEQYRRAAYWYFTAMAALSLAPFSPYNRFSVWLPLAFVLILGILRELWEDLRRYRGDNLVNSRPVLVHDGEGHLLEKQWKHLFVGDIVKVMDGDYFPADLLLLSSTGPEGICYVETMNLDGETNLKVRQALQVTWAIGSKDEGLLRKFEANVKCEDPNASLYTFAGLLEFPDGEAYPIGPSQLLLRDSSLQNTGSVIGVVIYTGHDTKVMQNSSPVPSKRSRLDRSLDRVIWVMFAVLLTLSSTTGIVLGLWIKNEGTSVWYLQPRLSDPYFNPAQAVIAGIISSLNGLVLYGYLIPISLYVSLEVVRVLQAALMMQDVQMYDPATDKPCRVKSAGLNEELGQVDTILSDKTGTLTCNQMDFFRCSIGGVSYGKGTTEVEASAARLGLPLGGASSFPDAINQESQLYKTSKILDSATTGNMTNGVESADHNLFKEKGFNFYDARLLGGNWATEENSQTIELFFRILALCHTAIPDGNVDNPSSMRYRAESPDEAALVVAAKQFGFYFYKRTPTTLYMRETLGPKAQPVDCKYQLLNVLEFSSARKRMSVIVRFPDGKLLLLCKGADSVVLQLLDPNNKGFSTQTNTHLKQYGEVGLRTLLIAYKELKEEEYIIWQAKFEEARSTMGRERDIRTEEAAEEIERGLTVVGGTGVEDKLQAGVPESVDRLAKAGIKIWVLTGDKMETAINIGYACSLLRQGMDKLIVSMEGVEAWNVEEKAQRDGLSRNEISKVGLISLLFSVVCGRLLKSTKLPIENWVPSWDSST